MGSSLNLYPRLLFFMTQKQTKPMTNFFMVMCATGIFYLGFDGALTDMTRNDCAAGIQAACEVLR